MSGGMTLMDNHLMPIQTINDTYVVDSRLVAKKLGIRHKNFMETVYKYQSQIEEFHLLSFEMEIGQRNQGGGKAKKYCYLSEDQAIFIGTLSRNTQKVIAFKAHLVKSFAIARRGDRSEATLSPAQIILKQAQQMVDFEQRITAIENDKQQAKEELQIIQLEGSKALFADTRKSLDHFVKSYARYKQLPVPQIYETLYERFSVAYGINLKLRAKRANKTPIAWLESRGYITEAYELAKQLFVMTMKSA